eukprot:GHVT01002178.1.p1 GENE.GHVT01002178.1~~GHVT01002178.1.p1  ORF type:complete len:559 (+),score=92.24 GHVT01002178.1:2856-4532(+)
MHTYVSSLFQKVAPLSSAERYARPFWDYLQMPLQPLHNDLESQTYENFEQCPVKYEKYEEAISKCLRDRRAMVESEVALSGKSPRPVVVMVVGAGRGPLVQRTLQALESSGMSAPHTHRIIAIEKNRNAVLTLRHRIQQDPHPGWRHVQLLAGDTRVARPSLLADVLVSELLGSFGDNELSPECLDGAQRFLRADGVSIPQRYTSTIEPISNVKVWNDVRSWKQQKSFETPYVCALHSVYRVAAEPPAACFDFCHPNPQLSADGYSQRFSSVVAHANRIANSREETTRGESKRTENESNGRASSSLERGDQGVRTLAADAAVHADTTGVRDTNCCTASQGGGCLSESSKEEKTACSSGGVCSTSKSSLRNGSDSESNLERKRACTLASQMSALSTRFGSSPLAEAAEAVGLDSSLAEALLTSVPWPSPPAPSASASSARNLVMIGAVPSSHNERYGSFDFTCRSDALVHGFAGYFHCVLYDNVTISIDPTRDFDAGMFSWFPIYFPLREPMLVSHNQTLTLKLWRKTDIHKVWYEWAVASAKPSYLHNPNGRSYCITK